MLFNSYVFGLFLPLTFLLYWLVFNKSLTTRNLFLATVSYFFYGWWDWRFLILLFVSTCVDFFLSQKIQNEENKRVKLIYLVVSIVLSFSLLGFFKYYNFFAESFVEFASYFGLKSSLYTLNVILPVGISFYTFQTMSYIIDVYRGKLRATDDFVGYLAYVSYFPQLVAGPIERASNLLPQIKRLNKFSYPQAVDGMRLILYGFFKKVVIADNLSIYTDRIFDSYRDASLSQLIMGAVMFAFQIYGDFSGYTDIARGVSKLFGIELMINFKTPYFSRDIAEFWRRWHISLTTWFKDYVYIPLGGSRVSKFMTLRNTFIVFLLSGFWHGANWTFIFWGLLNALFFLPLLILNTNQAHVGEIAKDRSLPTWSELFKILFTFSLICLTWIFFRSPSLASSFDYILSFVHPGNGINTVSLAQGGAAIFLIVLFDWFFRNDEIPFKRFSNKGIRYASYSFICLIILLYGSFINPQSFIYFQF